ncbi:hypothetical protein P154DRAFT_476000 [Amniculicola lignicola CBS 123094]|uniref:Uncharacterized protein n=1 Tax=Amniculicola lignicola CBS 123094 TaxID=1392246 RepID=A0A6A5VZK6_9PLEO|nr:hypothetical protein P154DRAFT_476000 [Amniculicola lignicola CBS 123094]
MALLLAPYNDSMRLGMGFNSYTQTMCIDEAVEFDKDNITTVQSDNTSQVVSYSSRFVEKLSDVVDSMNISYGSSIKRGTVEISGNTNSVNEDKIKASDLNAIVSVKVVNQTTTLLEDCKFKPINNIKPGSSRFNDIYGDCYISGFIEGGEFTGIISMRALDRSKVDNVTSSIKSSMGTAAKAEFTMDSMSGLDLSVSESLKETETTLSVSWMGGGQIKEADRLWDMDSMFASAAAFPARVAECPQRTWAILTKYKANRSFVEYSQASEFTPLEYENISSYTEELFENFMEYKQLLKKVQDILRNPDRYMVKPGGHNPIPLDVPTMIAVRAALRNEMNKIVEAVDVLTKDPGILKRERENEAVPTNEAVRSILLEAQNKTTDSSTPSDKSPVKTGTEPQERPDEVHQPEVKSLSFNFASLVAPEIWADHMPILNENAPIDGSNSFEHQATQSIYPPPPEEDEKTDQPEPKPDPEPDLGKLTIHAASWGGTDVTSFMRNFISAEQTWALDTSDIASKGISDPWPGVRKSLSILYQYEIMQEMGILIAADGSGVQRISPAIFRKALKGVDMSASSNHKIVRPPGYTEGLEILAVVWGDCLVTSEAVWSSIRQCVSSRLVIPLESSFFGGDTWAGISKSGAIYFRRLVPHSSGPPEVKATNGKEHGSLIVSVPR